MLNNLALAALILTVISFILIVVGVATDKWVFVDGNYLDISLAIGASSDFNSRYRSKGQTAYAFCIIATLGAGIAMITNAIMLLLQFKNIIGQRASAFLRLAAILGTLIGSISGVIGSLVQVVWTATTIDSSKRYIPGYSFLLTFFGSILLFVGAILALMSARNENEQSSQQCLVE